MHLVCFQASQSAADAEVINLHIAYYLPISAARNLHKKSEYHCLFRVASSVVNYNWILIVIPDSVLETQGNFPLLQAVRSTSKIFL